ncbi:MAG: hypothetical protein SVV03_00060, partial [Candidatus Nanohaloarchaea archaeon]|nr:hypothetical protein [Candidatus Nanohaloarchaea archaeon]
MVKLCQGDEGDIQVNKGGPYQEGEAGGGNSGPGSYYSFIEITKLGTNQGEECERISSEPPQVQSIDAEREGDTLLFDISVENRRLGEEGFAIRVPRQPGAPTNIDSLSDSQINDHWKTQIARIGSDDAETVSMRTGPATQWSCDSLSQTREISILVEESSGSWSEVRQVDISNLVDKCGGNYVPDAYIQSTEVEKA